MARVQSLAQEFPDAKSKKKERKDSDKRTTEITIIQLYWCVTVSFRHERLFFLCHSVGHGHPRKLFVLVGGINGRVPGLGVPLFAALSSSWGLEARGQTLERGHPWVSFLSALQGVPTQCSPLLPVSLAASRAQNLCLRSVQMAPGPQVFAQ